MYNDLFEPSKTGPVTTGMKYDFSRGEEWPGGGQVRSRQNSWEVEASVSREHKRKEPES